MDSITGTVSSLTTTAIDALSTVTSTALSFLPPFLQHLLHTSFFTVQSLLAERWEVRVVAIFLLLPTAAIALMTASIAVALLWPFTFLAATVGGLALTSTYLFWPNATDVKTSAAQRTPPPHTTRKRSPFSPVPCSSSLCMLDG